MEIVILAVVIAVVVIGALGGLVIGSRKKKQLPPQAPSSTPTITAPPAEPKVGDEAETPRDEPRRTIEEVELPLAEPTASAPVVEEPVVAEPAAPEIETPEPTAGRMVRLRARLSRSQNALGKGLLTLLSREHLDEDTWEEIEDTLLTADVGVAPTQELVERLRERVRVLGTRTPDELRTLLREELIKLLGTADGADFDRTVKTESGLETPGIVMVVGVNGTGKTTTTGKLARVLVADGRTVVLGAADTFRAAAADQLQTWGERVGARTVRGPEGGDPASIAFDSVKEGIADGADVVLIDTAGRLHTKTGLMDELGKVKRVVEKHAPLDEVLLVLDATTGQNGLIQARVFAEVVDITGIVLTKLDGTAKGGIVVAVQRELGVPVKLVGLGEGADDLAPFEPEAFVDALIGD
ncbi:MULTISPECIES: signal recognition particle-docking protein FtsY [Streptomyces]|uniref:Signal recognition particle receptor FtsY n=1 Tax=Streptomyces venezuelae TaxID=54571 RepID=A0A5P2BH69_STRVZ|nr:MULTISPECIES: signal recognition particle-docking protein FtsY [Streptomyces]NDZ98280.1 signal recognition particle-docking protein FtsY [Streptomyces sp. SID10116]MYY83141.1 signal recognition particle-docking protein FtsY [Streptomyces sp. SID335]MYZ14761.1 signal recognition particle-docking protein FtsY [Streptomyces sp. SID337]NDZ86619.1 signal recognition particle-docking protein FtsY [Streptomyces sp. SID10115]NEB44022.1 signal recognition particle-docking protein FtsY [Streptomyces 